MSQKTEQKRQFQARPDIFRYHDYRAFLKDWFAYLKRTRADFSMRTLASEAKLASGYLPMVLSSERNLSFKTLQRILPLLHLTKTEQGYFEKLVRMGTPDSPDAKLIALDSMSRSQAYQKRNPNEAEFFIYMSHWYYIAIREMATLPGFQMDPAWIQERLKARVSLNDIRAALDFLVRHKYIERTEEGSVVPPKSTLECQGHVYWAALTQYHRQMFSLATESIDETDSNDRNLTGYTFTLNKKRFDAAQKILNEAMARIEELENAPSDEPSDSVYHLELALFPITRREKP